MPRDYIPGREAELVTWSANFSALLNAQPTAYGTTALQASAYEVLHDAFVSSFNLASNAATRTPSAIINKDLNKKNLIENARMLARIIQANPEVTDSQRSDLGLTVRAAEPTPVPPPAHAPDLDVVSVTGRTVRIRLHDAANPTRRGKPVGVDGASIFTYVGATPPAALADWTFRENATRTTVDVAFDPDLAPGTLVWITACWFNPRAQNGPAAPAVSTNLAGGAAQAA